MAVKKCTIPAVPAEPKNRPTITEGEDEVSLMPIDAGFDAIDAGIPVNLPAGVGAVRVPDGTARGRLITGSREEIVRELRTLGYQVREGGAA